MDLSYNIMQSNSLLLLDSIIVIGQTFFKNNVYDIYRNIFMCFNKKVYLLSKVSSILVGIVKKVSYFRYKILSYDNDTLLIEIIFQHDKILKYMNRLSLFIARGIDIEKHSFDCLVIPSNLDEYHSKKELEKIIEFKNFTLKLNLDIYMIVIDNNEYNKKAFKKLIKINSKKIHNISKKIFSIRPYI